mgnify:CR=1 FL=1
MPTARRPPHVIVADEAADRARAADQRQRAPVIVERECDHPDEDLTEGFLKRQCRRCGHVLLVDPVTQKPQRGDARGVTRERARTVAFGVTLSDAPIDDGPGAYEILMRAERAEEMRRAGAVCFDPDSLTRPTILRRRSPAEVRDHHLATIRSSLIGLGLTGDAASKLTEEIERLTVEVGR